MGSDTQKLLDNLSVSHFLYSSRRSSHLDGGGSGDGCSGGGGGGGAGGSSGGGGGCSGCDLQPSRREGARSSHYPNEVKIIILKTTKGTKGQLKASTVAKENDIAIG